MQQIERYGVIALLFLLVTIVVVALWDGGQTSHAGEGDNAEGVAEVKKPVQQRGTQPADRRATPAQQRQDRTMPRVSLSDRETSQDEVDRRRNNYIPRPAAPLKANQPSVQPGVGSNAMGNVGARNPGFRSEPRQPRAGNQFGRVEETAQNTPVRDPGPTARQPVRGTTQAQPGPAATSRVIQPVAVSQVTYTVKPGDSLQRIARDILGSTKRWREIQTLNGITRPDAIAVGAVLKMPAGANVNQASVNSNAKTVAVNKTAAKKARAQKTSQKGTYVVQPRDVLSRIAQQQLGSAKRYQEIVNMNPGLKPDRLLVGMVLKMPSDSKAKTSTGTSAKPAVAKVSKKRNRVQ